MKTNTWAFLVSRNESVDYKTIVAPDFIDAAKLRSLLTKATEGDLTPPGKANVRWIQHSAAGDFSIVFRVVKARAVDIGESSSDILKDGFGRAIYLVEGLVFQEAPDLLWKRITISHLEQAHAQVQADYQRFWETNETTISACFPLQERTSNQILALEELETIVMPSKSRQPGKSNKALVPVNPLVWEQIKLQPNFALILVTTTIVFILFSLLIGQLFGGANITAQQPTSGGCTYVTQLQRIPYNTPKNWSDALEDLEKKNQPATLFVSTAIPDQLSAKQEMLGNEESEPTLKPKQNGTTQMKFHPLKQAIMQLRDENSKFVFEKNTTLEVRMIKPTQNGKAQCL